MDVFHTALLLLPNLTRYADPDAGLFRYPARQKRTKETTEAMQTAEGNLDTFWAEFDRHIAELDADVGEKVKAFSSARVLARTPDWVPPPVAKNGSSTSRTLALPFGQLSVDARSQHGATTNAQEAREKKEKVKTRGAADPSKANETAAAQQAGVVDPPAKAIFRLSRRAMRVVGVLFYEPLAHNQPGDVDWKDFVHTMGAIGFAKKTMYGSAWSFTPKGEKLTSLSKQSIMIHSPHPVAKIDFFVARRIGRRLTRTYGLDESSFEEEDS